ncbi:hypothetical protein N431DRAFT_414338 [Stipitochalara longipes BDJ]|nr:hypothetical protein N431DRAFT_414338 [Stipitochalara longipes BDJ]
MVYTGKPSRGCEVCRRRRIKCDEKSPGCSYCTKTGQPCPGYKDMFELAWRDQTTVAQKSVERRKRAGAKAASNERLSDTELTFQVLSESSALLSNTSVPTSPPPNQHDLEDFALTFWFTNYANPPMKSYEECGFVEHVAPLFLKSTPESTLRLSTLAVATILFTAWSDLNPDTALTRSFYLKAVSAMRDQLSMPGECTNNEMIMSVLLLQMYETLIGNARKRPSTRAHLSGAMALVKHRGLQNFEDRVSKAILYWIRYLCIEESLKTCEPVYCDPEEWSNIPQYTALPANSSLDGINLNLARLQATISQEIATGSNNLTVDTQGTLQAARSIDRQLIEWSGTLPLSWLAIRVAGEDCIPPSTRQAGLYQSHCHVYKSIQIAYLWNRQRISRIRAQKIMLAQLSLQEPSLFNSTSQGSCQNIIQQLADDVCATVPFYLGDRSKPGSIGDRNVKYPHARGAPISEAHYQMAPASGGYQLLGALGTLLSLDIKLRDGQKQWIGGQMMRLSKIYNLGRR